MAEPDETLCFCNDVGRAAIVDAAARGATTVREVQDATGAGTGSRC